MTPHAAAVENGRTPYHGLFLLLMILMAALIAGRSLTRTDPIAQVPADLQLEVSEQLACLWVGELPPTPSAAVQMLIGEAMWKAGTAARDEAVAAAEVLADELYAAQGPDED